MTTLLAVSVILLAILTFGQPLIFDRLFVLLLLIATILTFPYDKNACFAILILLIQRGSEELLWLLQANTWWFKAPAYTIALGCCYVLRYARLNQVVAATILLILCAEAYWLLTDYPAPAIYWLALLLLINVVTRYALFARPALMCQYLPAYFNDDNVHWIALDFRLHYIVTLFIFLAQLNTLEYLIRHLLGYYQVQFIYTLTPYAAHAMSCLIIWFILQQLRTTLSRYKLHL